MVDKLTPPFYNYATLPVVSDRDAFWDQKQNNTKTQVVYEDIVLPKNTGIGVYIGIFASAFGFGIIWHIWWLAIVAFLAIIVCVLIRTNQDETEYVLTAAEVEALEMKREKGKR